MNEQHKYRSTDKMSDLICDNYSLLMVMSRFGLSLGFGDKSVKDVCEAQGVDCPTFLAVANFISEELQDEVGYIVCTGTIDGFNEFAADGRQVEVEEIRVGTLQIIHKGA